MTCRCYENHLDRSRSNILLIGEGRTNVYDHYLSVNCIKCGCGEEIYNREMNDIYAGKIIIEGSYFSHSVFVREYAYVMQLLGSSKVPDDRIYNIMVAIVDAYIKNYYMYWDEYVFQNVRRTIVKVLSSKKYDDCSKEFLTKMKKELKKLANEPFCLEDFLKDVNYADSDEKWQKKYGPAGVKQVGHAKGKNYNEKYLEKKIYFRKKKEIRAQIFGLQKGIIEKLVKILRQNHVCINFSHLKVNRKITLNSIKCFVNDSSRDSIFLRGYSMVFENVLKLEFSTSKDINERNYEEIIQKLEKIDWFVSKYLN